MNGSPSKTSEDLADEVEVRVVHVSFGSDDDVQLVEAACFGTKVVDVVLGRGQRIVKDYAVFFGIGHVR